MQHTGIAAFSHGAEQAQQWVNELARDLKWTDERRAFRVLRSVLHALRDWIAIEEAADLSAQLPILVRGVYFEGWNPSKSPVKRRKRKDFIKRIKNDFTDDPLDQPAEAIATALALLDRKLPGGEIRQVRQSLPKSLRKLWQTA